MGDDAVVLEGAESEKARTSLYSTIHGAGRVLGRKDARRRLTPAQMDAWLRKRGVTLIGAVMNRLWPIGGCLTCCVLTPARSKCCMRCGHLSSSWPGLAKQIRGKIDQQRHGKHRGKD
jgi:hypothetical protein